MSHALRSASQHSNRYRSIGDAVGLGTDLTVAVGLGGGALSSSPLRGVGRGVGAGPRLALRLLFEPKLPITVAGVDSSRLLELELLLALLFPPLVLLKFVFEITSDGVALTIG